MNPTDFSLRNVVRPVLDGFLPRFSGDEKALQLVLRLRASIYLDYDHLTDECKAVCDKSEEDDGQYESVTEDFISVQVNYLFVRPMNYTMVLQQIGVGNEVRNMNFHAEGEYAEVGNHDSCWDSSFNELDRLMYKQGDELLTRLRGNLKPEFQPKQRVNYDTHIEIAKLRDVKLEEIDERKWIVKFL